MFVILINHQSNSKYCFVQWKRRKKIVKGKVPKWWKRQSHMHMKELFSIQNKKSTTKVMTNLFVTFDNQYIMVYLEQLEVQYIPHWDHLINCNCYDLILIWTLLSGFSDPYCMLGIMPLRRMQSLDGTESSSLGSSDEENSPRCRDKEKGAFKRFSQKKKSSAAVRDLLPAKYIQTTSVIPNSLNPVWNERFRL